MGKHYDEASDRFLREQRVDEPELLVCKSTALCEVRRAASLNFFQRILLGRKVAEIYMLNHLVMAALEERDEWVRYARRVRDGLVDGQITTDPPA